MDCLKKCFFLEGSQNNSNKVILSKLEFNDFRFKDLNNFLCLKVTIWDTVRYLHLVIYLVNESSLLVQA